MKFVVTVLLLIGLVLVLWKLGRSLTSFEDNFRKEGDHRSS